MATKLEDIIARMPPERRLRVERETNELIAEEMALRELRKAVQLTQARMAELLGIGQDSVSRLEQRCDLLVSTLRDYVAAMGGRLRLVAELPNHPPVELVGLSNLGEVAVLEKKAAKARKTAKAGSRRRAATRHNGGR